MIFRSTYFHPATPYQLIGIPINPLYPLWFMDGRKPSILSDSGERRIRRLAPWRTAFETCPGQTWHWGHGLWERHPNYQLMGNIPVIYYRVQRSIWWSEFAPIHSFSPLERKRIFWDAKTGEVNERRLRRSQLAALVRSWHPWYSEIIGVP